MPAKTTAKNPPPSAIDRATLDAALERLRESSRAVMFAPLIIGAFAKKSDKLSKKVAAARFEELLALDAATIVNEYRLTRKDAAAISAIIESLLEGDTPAQSSRAQDAVAALLPARSPKIQSSIGINSVEAELKLTAALAKLRTSPLLTTLAHHRIGDYWDPSWARAPFEEALTFEQLSQVKPRSLLDKRSFTQQKLSHLLAALERALQGTTTAASPTSPHHTPQETRSSQPASISIERWRAESAEYPSTVLGSLLLYADEAAKVPEQFAELRRVLHAIPEKLTAREYLAAVLQEELDSATVGSLLKIDHNTVQQCAEAAYQKIESVLKELSAVLHQSFVATLSQPATQVATLAQLLRPDTPPSQFIAMLSMLLARSVGAAPVVIGAQVQRTVWSRNASAAERALRLLVAGLPKNNSELQADATALLGNIPFDTVREWLKPLTYFSERTLTWSKRE